MGGNREGGLAGRTGALQSRQTCNDCLCTQPSMMQGTPEPVILSPPQHSPLEVRGDGEVDLEQCACDGLHMR